MLSPKAFTVSNNISWVILAGGQASRMGGQDKGLLMLHNIPLIKYVFDKLAQQTDSITINANRNIEIYRQYAPVISDHFQNYPGPLAGIHSGLMNCNTEWVGFVPCDCPQISDDLVMRFEQQISAEKDILVAMNGEHYQPVFTLFHQRTRPKLEAFLQRGERKIIALYKECNTGFVDFSDSPNCFINLNTPEELAHFGAEQ